MSKAYDLVNRGNLWKAMRRIKLPERFINIIRSSLENRTNRVITDLGMTEEYKMENGIDQGEIISPLLWIIYYDPVFTKIKKHKGIGYTTEHKWREDLAYAKTNSLNIELFNIAYMDDTTWLGNSKRNLEIQLKIADSFNRFNGIKVNPEKSKLIVINGNLPKEEQYVKYSVNETIIQAEDDKESIRFLGVWISSKNNKNFIKKQISKDINNIFYITKGKTITAEQMAYVINAVAIPRIEYKSQLTTLSNKEATTITANLRRLLRYKIGITNTAPNIILSNKEIYKMIDYFERQTEAHIALNN